MWCFRNVATVADQCVTTGKEAAVCEPSQSQNPSKRINSYNRKNIRLTLRLPFFPVDMTRVRGHVKMAALFPLYIQTIDTSKGCLMTNQVAAIHSLFKALIHAFLKLHEWTLCPTCHTHSFIRRKQKRGKEVVKKKRNLFGRMGNPGDIFFCAVFSLWGQMPAGLPPHCLPVCVPVSSALSN